jgi:predicted glycogen debranching enzyme
LLSDVPETVTPLALPSVDASLWLFEAARHLHAQLGDNDAFLTQRLLPVLIGIFDRIAHSPRSLVWLSNEGLLETRNDGEPATWMDSIARGHLVTPRRGLVVELQALWTRAADTLHTLATGAGKTQLAEEALTARDRARAAFKQRFWCNESNYPFDYIDEQAGPAYNSAIRPNALVALDLDPDLFEVWQAHAIVEQVKHRLLTSRGVRSLDPSHPSYIGDYEGGMDRRREAYHQGVVWGFLLGAYARAALRLEPDNFELQMDIRENLLSALENGTVLGQVAQIASGDHPYHPGGCPAQAWSVAEILRTLQWDLGT